MGEKGEMGEKGCRLNRGGTIVVVGPRSWRNTRAREFVVRWVERVRCTQRKELER